MARTPVIFIPGITGSFNLGVLLDWRGPTLSGWGFPPFIDYGKGFLDAFAQAGYRRDQDLFVAFYDWRKSVSDSASNYLKPWIDRARRRAGTRKVILVGHSMGGLVARSYIQSRAYANDVERLITLGTPHRGSSNAYYAWGDGDMRADANVRVVFDVYLWYLRHAHPFQTELSRLRTMRTQVPGVRDLLPIDGYLLNDGAPATPKQPTTLVERNLVGELLNQSDALDTLFGRVPVTTITGVGFPTIRSIVVAGPPLPPESPPRYPDGAPVRDELNPDGDGTVLRLSAQLAHPQARNTPAISGAGHGALPDHPAVLSHVFDELGLPAPTLGAAPATEPRLVIMTASPVTMDIETPAGPPMLPAEVLGAAPVKRGARRARVLHSKNYGHAGKHLNLTVVPQPTAGTYNVRLTGTSTGSFALGALMISSEGVTVLGGGAEEVVPQPRDTAITTRYGKVAAGSELFYNVSCYSLSDAPAVALDPERTRDNAMSRMREAMSDAGGVLGGAADTAPQLALDAVMSGVTDPDAQLDALSSMAAQTLGAADPVLAEALVMQLQAAHGEDSR
jgi:pimeloyl-ACP methyl ester carboxylesterase